MLMDLISKVKEKGFTGSILGVKNRSNIFFKNSYVRLRVIIAKLMRKDVYVVKEINGMKMMLNLSDEGISRELLVEGVHEKNSTECLQKYIKPGMVVVEVGANIGYYALLSASLMKENGKIIAFEPSPKNVDALKANIAVNDLDSFVEFYPQGVGDKNTKLKLNVMNKGNMSSFVDRGDGGGIKNRSAIEVDVVKLDDFFAGRKNPDFLRMDVEGFEYEIIQGMLEILKSSDAPTGMFIEVHSELLNRLGRSCKQFLDILKNNGYLVVEARYRGKDDKGMLVNSTEELLEHPLCEDGYWEAFFEKAA